MAEHIEILVGTTAGNTEFLASELETEIQQKGFTTTFHDAPNLPEVTKQGIWLFCVATHGAGEYAESIEGFMEQLNQEKPDLSNIKFAIIAIGDSSYDTFCQAGRDTDALVQSLGGVPIHDVLEIDMMFDLEPETSAIQWLAQWIDKIA
ncbi:MULTISPECIES: flavodoxin domain-containing protein [Gammaproteobacteria]|uniref:flavodoxin domain-containing protein n=1 Tax=Gammaproteobacteria TaxID=1236 RepID=UPI000DD0E3C8|nr:MULTISPECIES: flavodoxin domain-containing protein [Gammaproteobacteria]RTE86699.1 FMN-binding protein MioC [Aliidiomarina sp. B3213]TCZ90747.1 FMN-binding protein MioC [Lysobacter sp. N42]